VPWFNPSSLNISKRIFTRSFLMIHVMIPLRMRYTMHGGVQQTSYTNTSKLVLMTVGRHEGLMRVGTNDRFSRATLLIAIQSHAEIVS
jgi:hypothetical protein